MAQTNTAYGFVPWGPLLTVRQFNVRGSDNWGPYYKGDVMTQQADGYVTAGAGGSTLIVGANLTFVTGLTTGVVRVACDPDQLFHAQDNTAGTLTIADVGENVDFKYAAGSVNTKLSGSMTDSQADTVVVAANFKLLGLLDNLDITSGVANTWGQYVKVVGKFNEHILSTTSAY